MQENKRNTVCSCLFQVSYGFTKLKNHCVICRFAHRVPVLAIMTGPAMGS
jgi:hypothetical protein